MNPLVIIGGVGALSLYTIAKASSPINYRADMNSNLSAILAVIRDGESSNNYSAYVSFDSPDSFSNLNDHPIATGEKSYKNRPDTGEPTSAAGAYQITYSTWLDVKQPDFSPYSQDSAAIALIKRCGAYTDVLNGDIPTVIHKLSGTWEMFKQAKWDVVNVTSKFNYYGGVTL